MGIYTGVTPCADCEGIYTRLELIDSITFIKSSKYLGKSSRAFLDMGQWTIENDSIVSTIAHGSSQRYLHDGTGLIMLNQEGKRIKGPLANYYKLTKGEPEKRNTWRAETTQGIDFIAQGNEPSWNLELDFEKGIRFRTIEGDSVVSPLSSPTTDGLSTVYSITTEAATFVLKLSPVGCIHTMSGAYSDYAVEIKLNKTASMSGCGEFINTLYHLTGSWTLASIKDEVVKESDFGTTLPTLSFHVIERKVSGSTGCNRLSGSFQADADGKFNFLPLATTRMLCAGKGENLFLQALNQVDRYQLEGDKLSLMKDDIVLLSFVADGM